jgi:hypothetical protein
MVSSEIKTRVAQNCDRYRTGYDLGLINSITYMSQSCSGCISYVKEKCTEGLFDEIREIIRVN